MHDRSGETSGAGDTPIAAVRAGEVPELESRGELAMSKLSSGKEPRADARHVPSLSAEQASARLEKTLGARWRALSDAEKSRLVASARASFQEAEQRKRLAKADPGASKPSADPARDTTHAPAERAPREHRDEAARRRRRRPNSLPHRFPSRRPRRARRTRPRRSKRKRGRPPKVKAARRGAPAPGVRAETEKRKPNASPAGAWAKKPNTSVFIADGPPSFPPGGGTRRRTPARSCRARRRSVWSRRTGSWRPPYPRRRATLLGRGVAGVVDGAFAGGYFLTVRVDGCLLRGLVWDPDDARAT